MGLAGSLLDVERREREGVAQQEPDWPGPIQAGSLGAVGHEPKPPPPPAPAAVLPAEELWLEGVAGMALSLTRTESSA